MTIQIPSLTILRTSSIRTDDEGARPTYALPGDGCVHTVCVQCNPTHPLLGLVYKQAKSLYGDFLCTHEQSIIILFKLTCLFMHIRAHTENTHVQVSAHTQTARTHSKIYDNLAFTWF